MKMKHLYGMATIRKMGEESRACAYYFLMPRIKINVFKEINPITHPHKQFLGKCLS
jgi:hypothetical protein